MRSKRARWLILGLAVLSTVTVSCLWLVWQWIVVLQRQSLLAEARRRYYAEVTTVARYQARLQPTNPAQPVPQIPMLRRWLGDEAIQEITVAAPVLKPAEEAELRRWFPEARIVRQAPLQPCHPGCFPQGTLVETVAGPRAIETIEVGTALVAFDRSGNRRSVAVSAVFTTTNRLVEIVTSHGTLWTTPTQPLATALTRPVPAGDVREGDTLLTWSAGELQEVRVEQARQTERIARVFNLVLRDSELFVAGGYLARSKPPADTPLDAHPPLAAATRLPAADPVREPEVIRTDRSPVAVDVRP